MMNHQLGPIVCSFFLDHLQVVKGLRPSSLRSYRDGIRIFLCFVAADAGRKLSRITLNDLTFERVVSFLRYLEEERGNHPRSRNQRLAILHVFFEYLALRAPEMLAVAQRVSLVPNRRVPPPETFFLERNEIADIFSRISSQHRYASRDRALLLFLYNTGARAQEAADLCVGDLELDGSPRVRLHGKGDKWRVCPLWNETAQKLRCLLDQSPNGTESQAPVFLSQQGKALTRFGIYKIVRKYSETMDRFHDGSEIKKIGPHVFRHTAAVHLLDAGVEVNVIRGWLGHVQLETTNRYAEISLRAKQEALDACTPLGEHDAVFHSKPVWRNDEALLQWLDSL